jgi:hypothetical protein
MNMSVRTYRKIENEEIPLTPERKALALKVLQTTEQTLLQLEEQAPEYWRLLRLWQMKSGSSRL